MKNTIQRLCIAILMTSTCACQTGKRIDPIADAFPEKQETIKALLTEIFTVAKSKNMDSLDSYHLSSFKFAKFDDGEISGRQDYQMGKKTEGEFFTGVKDFDFTLPDTKVDVFDDMAIATFILDYRVVLNDASNTAIVGKSRGTLVFVENLGRWVIVHEHFSPVIGGQ